MPRDVCACTRRSQFALNFIFQFSSSLDFLVKPDSDWFLVCSGQLDLLPLLVSSLTEQWFTAGQLEFAQLLTTSGFFTVPLRTLQPKPDLSSSPAQFNSTNPASSLSSCSVHGMPFSDFSYPLKHRFLIALRAAGAPSEFACIELQKLFSSPFRNNYAGLSVSIWSLN